MSDRDNALYFIVNRFAGGGVVARLERGIRSLCGKHRVPYEISFTAAPRHATELAAQAVEAGFRKIIAVGGDGTINEVAQALVHTSASMGIIPKGSGNGLARHLGIPMKIESALNYLFHSETVGIDTFELNGRLSLNVSGIGFDSFIATRFAGRSRRGLAGYAQLVLQGYGDFEEFDVAISSGGRTLAHKAFVVAIANASQYGNNARIAPGASVCDQQLNIVLLRKFPVYRLDIIASFFNGKIDRSEWAETLLVQDAVIEVPNRLAYHVDGEPAGMDDRFTVKLNPVSLNVLVPQDKKR